MGNVPATFLRTARHVCWQGGRQRWRQPCDCWKSKLDCWRDKEVTLCNRPIAPGTSAKSSAPLGQRFFPGAFSFLGQAAAARAAEPSTGAGPLVRACRSIDPTKANRPHPRGEIDGILLGRGLPRPPLHGGQRKASLRKTGGISKGTSVDGAPSAIHRPDAEPPCLRSCRSHLRQCWWPDPRCVQDSWKPTGIATKRWSAWDWRRSTLRPDDERHVSCD